MIGTKRSRSAVGFLFGALLLAACKSSPPPETKPAAPAEELVVTPTTMARFIENYFSVKSKDTGDVMVVRDPVANTDVRLKLKPIQTAEMNSMGMGIYYSCVPMEDESGATYDVDFISEKTSRGMSFVEATIHKTPTETRYEWVKNEREVWEKRPT